MPEPAAPLKVAHVLFDGFTTLDMYGPVQAFASCREPDGAGGWRRHFEQLTVGPALGPVRSGEGPSTVADYLLDDPPAFDILLVPGGFGTRAAVSDARFLDQVARLSERAETTATVCTGSAVLARTGRLDGRRRPPTRWPGTGWYLRAPRSSGSARRAGSTTETS